jgi:hypothetical protein
MKTTRKCEGWTSEKFSPDEVNYVESAHSLAVVDAKLG